MLLFVFIVDVVNDKPSASGLKRHLDSTEEQQEVKRVKVEFIEQLDWQQQVEREQQVEWEQQVEREQQVEWEQQVETEQLAEREKQAEQELSNQQQLEQELSNQQQLEQELSNQQQPSTSVADTEDTQPSGRLIFTFLSTFSEDNYSKIISYLPCSMTFQVFSHAMKNSWRTNSCLQVQTITIGYVLLVNDGGIAKSCDFYF